MIVPENNSFYCRMAELSEGDTSMLPANSLVAQEAFIVGQRLATVALGQTDGTKLLDLCRGTKIPTDNERLKLGVFTVVAREVTSAFDLITARVYLRTNQGLLDGRAPIETIADIGVDNSQSHIRDLYDVTTDLTGNW